MDFRKCINDMSNKISIFSRDYVINFAEVGRFDGSFYFFSEA